MAQANEGQDLLKAFAKQEVTVTVVKTAKDPKTGAVVQLRDPETKRFVTEAVPLAAEHILGSSVIDGVARITTIDGQKYSAALVK